ncbi:MAG: hypothetical protein RL641_880, partial [Candidatus Parcubacteria bacterium]
GIFIAPSISVDKSQVKKGDDITIFGQSATEATITIQVNSNQQFFANAQSDKNGVYLTRFDTTKLELGSHSTKSKASLTSEFASNYGQAALFTVGNQNIDKKPGECTMADLNCDKRVDILDFSIAAYWYNRPLSESFKEIEKTKLSKDGKINLVDFSIIAYYWTG